MTHKMKYPFAMIVMAFVVMSVSNVSCSKKQNAAPGLHNMDVREITDEGATLTWSGNAASYEVLIDGYRHLSQRPIYRVTGLKPNTQYDWKVRTFVDGLAGEWADGKTFRTLKTHSFDPPTALGVTDIRSRGALLSWEGSGFAFEVEINGNATIVEGKRHEATGLLPQSHYTWRVRSVDDGGASQWVEGPDFMTPTESVL